MLLAAMDTSNSNGDRTVPLGTLHEIGGSEGIKPSMSGPDEWNQRAPYAHMITPYDY